MARKKVEIESEYKKAPDLQNLAKSRKYKYLTAEEVAELFHYSKSHGGEVTVAYNPEDVTSIWLLDNGTYIEFTIIESRFEGKDLITVQGLRMSQKAIAKGASRDNLQAQIGLARHIETIASNVSISANVSIQNIRDNRKREQHKHHRNYMEGAR